jgi:CubicO group peptidase (beta-lactamase class C family)
MSVVKSTGVVLALAVAGHVAATPPAPTSTSAIEALGERYVRAVNNPDTLAARATLDSIVLRDPAVPGVDRWYGQVRRIREMLGPLKFHHAEVSGPRRDAPGEVVMHVFVQASGAWKDLQFFATSAPPRLKQLVFMADVTEPVYLPNGDIADPTTLKWLDGYVDRLAGNDQLYGAILIAQGDSVLFERYTGFEDVGRKRPITPATRFNLGSGNKMFTALELARLVGEKKLSFDDPVSKFGLGFPDSVVDPRCTVRQLLSHTSGVREFWTAEYDRAKPVTTDLHGFVPWIARAGRTGTPGERFEYCNSNFILAGLIIEKLAGGSYFDQIRDHLYKPLGMSRSNSRRETDDAAGFASPLSRSKDKGWEIASRGPGGSSAGGGVSTARDMLSFARALVQGRLVPPPMVTEVTRSQIGALPASIDYGLGFERWKDGQVASYGHGGIAAGVNFELRVFPREDLTLITFSNQDNGAYDDLRKNAIKLITGVR